MSDKRFKQVRIYFYSYIGYDRPGDSKKMELIEIEILKRMGGNK